MLQFKKTDPYDDSAKINSSTSNIDTAPPANNCSSTLYLCQVCQCPVTWEQGAVLCDQCDNWYHTDCHNIDTLQYSRLGHSSVDWVCSECHNHDDLVSQVAVSTPASPLPLSSSDLSIPSFDSNAEPKLTSSPIKPRPTWTNDKPLRIVNINCQSISNKKGPWTHLIDGCWPDIIIATETWLNDTIKDSELESPGYTIYRKDRVKGTNGGVLIAINKSIKSSAISVTTNEEILWAKVSCRGQCDLLIGACYRHVISNQITILELFATTQTLTTEHNYDIFLGGDFNFPGFDWDNMSLKPNTPYVQLHQDFLENLTNYELKQLINETTRGANTLDLMITTYLSE